MRFYNREKELELLSKTKRISFEDHSQMTVLTGRRRIGKTKLVLKSCENEPTVYLFVARSNEAQLCAQFAQIASEALNTYVPSAISTFQELFRMLMEIGKYKSYNLIIDVRGFIGPVFLHGMRPQIYRPVHAAWMHGYGEYGRLHGAAGFTLPERRESPARTGVWEEVRELLRRLVRYSQRETYLAGT